MAIVHTCERCGEVCKDSHETLSKYGLYTADTTGYGRMYHRTVDLCDSCATSLDDWMDLGHQQCQCVEKEPVRKKKWWRKKR